MSRRRRYAPAIFAGGVAGGAAGVGLAAKLLVVGVVTVVGGSVLTSSVPDISASGTGEIARPRLPKQKSVDAIAVKNAKSLSKDQTRAKEITSLPKPQWPTARTVTVELPSAGDGSAKTDAEGVPVRVGRGKPSGKITSADADPGVERLTVRMHSRKDAKALGAGGVVFALSDPDGRGGPVDVELDYSSFATAYGASWASRLYLVELPACALSTPEKANCRTPERVEGSNNTKNQTLSGQIVVRGQDGETGAEPPPAEQEEQPAPTAPTAPTQPTEPTEPSEPPSSEESETPADGDSGEQGRGSDVGGGGTVQTPPSPTVLAAVAGAKGSDGDFGVSDLSAAGKWSAGGSSGDFSYSYPMGVPSVPGGLAPELAMAYNSGSVDGKTASTNGQTSWVGDGWDLAPGGYVERSYRSCAEDKGGNEPDDAADLCWYRDNLTIMVGGVSGELVKDSSGKWVATADAGAKIEHLTGAVNGARNGEYWKVTTTDGTQYFLGRNNPVSNSVNTVPVFGNDAGEPCHDTAFKDSRCQQAWRWNLDRVVDPLGNAMTFYYGHETNSYTAGDVEGPKVDYERGSYLRRIEYGLRASDLTGTPTAQVEFAVDERCVPSGSITCDPAQRTKANAAHWPDTPVDLECRNAPHTNCQAQWHPDGASGWWEPGSHSPSMFITKRLTKVTTKINTGSWQTVDSWSLQQSFPATGDGLSPSLWLKSVQRTGYAGTGDPIATPTVKFEGTLYDNRVDLRSDRPYSRYRITGVANGHGGFTGVNYRAPECRSGMTFPSPYANTLACFPIKWKPYNGYDEPITDWFHKYVVAEVVEQDLTGGSSGSGADSIHTRYEYSDNAAWAWDTNDAMEGSDRTWSVWRGYTKVTTRVGDPVKVKQLVTEKLYARGMDGDRLPTGTRTATVPTSAGSVEDHPAWAGMMLEERKLLDGVVNSTTITDPWRSAATATATRDDDTTARAYRSGVEGTQARAKLASGSWRYTESASDVNALGLPLSTEHRGEVTGWGGTPKGVVTCEKVDYVDNTAEHILGTVVDKTSFEGRCSSSATKDTTLGQERLAYDNLAFGDAPTKGLVTKADVLRDWPTAGKTWTSTSADYDAFGRQVKGVDVLGGESTTTYAPTSGPVTKVTSKDPLGHTASATMDPKRGQPVAVTDVAGYTTQAEFDTLGRTTKAWGPGRAKTLVPDAQFAYDYNATAPNWVRAQKRRDNDTYDTSYTLLDGLLRERQTQAPAVTGGRLINDKIYDSRGLVEHAYGPYWNSSAPSTSVVGVLTAQLPEHATNTYDTLGRTVKSTFMKFAEPQWSTETVHHGADLVATIPPSGGTAMAVKSDALGRAVEKRNYKTFAAARAGSNTASDFEATRYSYTPRGELASVTDPGQARWSFSYDLAGNKTRTSDPDAGVSTSTYDAAGKVATATDARGKTLSHVYDAIGRNTEIRRDSPSGEVLVKHVFDTLKPGLSTSSTRYVNGHGYKSETLGYDAQARPTGTRVTVPAVEGPLAGTYDFTTTLFSSTGKPLQERLPAAGGLPEETVYRGYDADGLPYSTYARTVGSTSTRTSVSDTTYTVFGEPYQLQRGPLDSAKNVLTTNVYEEGTHRLLRSIVDRESASQTTVTDRRYAYDDAGNITKISDVPLNGPRDVQCFDQDWQGRLTQAWTPANEDCASAPSTANLGGAAPYWQQWSFDAAGNRAQEVDRGPGGTTTRTFEQPPVNPEGLGQPHTTTRMVEQLPSGSQVQSAYGYDQAGNTTSRQLDGDTQTLQWDDFGRIDKITEGDGKTTDYLYDATGQRLLVRDPNATTLYLPGTELRLAKGATQPVGTRFYDHGGALIRQTNAAGSHWLMGDHQGTGATAVNVSNLSVTRRYQTPYGQPRGANPPQPLAGWPNTHGFVGGHIDTATGLTHIGARHYDPTLGNFTSIDPIIDYTDPVQMHGYGYANHTPITNSDPTGLTSCSPQYPEFCSSNPPPSGNSNNNGSSSGPTGGTGGTGGGRPGTGMVSKPAARVVDVQVKIDDFDGYYRGFWYFTPWDVDYFYTAHYTVEIYGDVCDADWVCEEVIYSSERKSTKRVHTEKDVSEWVHAYNQVDAFGKALAEDWKNCVNNPGLNSSCGGAALDLVGGAAGKLLKSEKLAKSVAAIAATAGIKASEIAAQVRRMVKAGCSFTPDTHVVMADGSLKPIEDVKLGDKVLATNPKTGKTKAREVTATWISTGLKTVIEISVQKKHGSTDAQPDGNADDALAATENHPFWAPSLKRWVRADQLKPGGWLRSSAGTWIQITTVETRATRQQRVYNLTVADDHTYYTAVGGTTVLGHNGGGPESCDIGKFGEAAAGITKNTKKIPMNGRDRIPDELDTAAKVIGEVKNVKYQHLSTQLRDYRDYALAKGYTFNLYVGQHTKLSNPLQALVDNSVITLKRLPG